MEQSIQDILFKDVVSVLAKYDVDYTEDSVMRLVRDWCLRHPCSLYCGSILAGTRIHSQSNSMCLLFAILTWG